MGGMPGKYKKRVRLSEQITALNRLKEQTDHIIEKQLRTEEAIDMYTQTAKQLLQEGRRDEAKQILIRKRYRERELQRSNAQLDQIDQLTVNLELTTELAQIKKKKVKRSKWMWFSKEQKKGYQNSQTHVENAEDIKITNLIRLQRKGKQKIFARTEQGIEKQREIDAAISHRLGIKYSTEATDKAVEKELEAILHADYQLPDMYQENIPNNQDNLQNANGLKAAADIADGA